MSLKKQRFISPDVAEYPPGHWSNCIRVGDQIWLSGFTSRANDLKTIQGEGSAYEQAKVIFQKIKSCLETAGSGLDDVVNMADNKEIWRARQEFFTGDFPCSTLVQVSSLAQGDIKLEIQAVAMAGSGKA